MIEDPEDKNQKNRMCELQDDALAADVILVAQTNVMLMEAEQMPPKITDGFSRKG